MERGGPVWVFGRLLPCLSRRMSRLIQLLRQFQLPVGATSAELRKAYFRQTWTCWIRGPCYVSGNVLQCHVMWWRSWWWDRKGRSRRKNQQLRHWRWCCRSSINLLGLPFSLDLTLQMVFGRQASKKVTSRSKSWLPRTSYAGGPIMPC